MAALAAAPLQILVFSKTASYRHDSIPAGVAALVRLAHASTASPASAAKARVPVSPSPLAVTASEDAEAFFTPEALARYAVVVLLQTSGTFLTPDQLKALRGFVRNGGGVVGVHCAACGMPKKDPSMTPGGVEVEGAVPRGWYGRLIGAVFTDHPEPQAGVVQIEAPEHPILAGTLGTGSGKWTTAANGQSQWEWFDEWYNWTEGKGGVLEEGDDLKVLLSVDETTYRGGKHGDRHPIAWCREFDGGRSFYTALGHFDEAYEDETFQRQLLNGILWAARLS